MSLPRLTSWSRLHTATSLRARIQTSGSLTAKTLLFTGSFIAIPIWRLARCQCLVYIAGGWWSPCAPVVWQTNTLQIALWGKYRMNQTQLAICIKVPHQSSQPLWQSAQVLPRSPNGMLFEMPLVFIFQALPHATSGPGAGRRVPNLPPV